MLFGRDGEYRAHPDELQPFDPALARAESAQASYLAFALNAARHARLFRMAASPSFSQSDLNGAHATVTKQEEHIQPQCNDQPPPRRAKEEVRGRRAQLKPEAKQEEQEWDSDLVEW